MGCHLVGIKNASTTTLLDLKIAEAKADRWGPLDIMATAERNKTSDMVTMVMGASALERLRSTMGQNSILVFSMFNTPWGQCTTKTHEVPILGKKILGRVGRMVGPVAAAAKNWLQLSTEQQK